jgi:radical SAM protein with 4Fe4S-binding SPASM domain
MTMGGKPSDKLGLDSTYLKFLRSYTLCRGEVDYPFQWLMIEPTNRCNLRCVMCPQAGKLSRKKGQMEFSLFRKVLDEAADFVKSVQLFHTGESLLHPRIFEMISYAAARNLYTLINTNGTLLDETKAHAILDSGLDSLSFSFDSFDRATYERIRSGARYEKTLENIERFLKLKAQRGESRPQTIIEIIDMVDTRPHLEAFASRARDMGFDEVRVWKFHNWTDPDPVVESHSPFSTNGSSYYPCEYPFMQLAVYWDGTVVPCCMDYDATYPLGDAREKGLREIWNGPRLAALRRSMRSKRTKKVPLCEDCSFLTEPKSYCSRFGKLFACYARLLGAWRR